VGSAALAGQGYLQITLAACLVPSIGYLLLQSHGKKLSLRPAWRWFVLAMALAILVGSVLLVPLARHLPNMSKDGDVTFSSAQPLRFMLLNLVIDDPDYHFSEILDKHPYPYLSNNYIGWIPLLLALLAPIMAADHQRPFILAAGIALVMIYLVSSALLLQWLMPIPWPLLQEFLAGMRNPAVGQGLAVPLLVAAATIALNGLLGGRQVDVQLTMSDNNTPVIPLRLPLIKGVLALLMVASLGSLFTFARVFLATYEEDGTRLRPLIEELDSSQAQWVQPVFGEHFWLPFAMEQDLKIHWYFRPWGLKRTQPLPPAYRQLSRVPEDAQLPEYVKTMDDILVLARPDYPYAYVVLKDGQVPCQAQALGGHIDVVCATDTGGTLVVLEHAVGGWRASLAGQRLPLKAGPWLSVAAPAGVHTYQFRYRPLEVLVGGIFSLVGWCLVLVGAWRGQPPRWFAKTATRIMRAPFPPAMQSIDKPEIK